MTLFQRCLLPRAPTNAGSMGNLMSIFRGFITQIGTDPYWEHRPLESIGSTAGRVAPLGIEELQFRATSGGN